MLQLSGSGAVDHTWRCLLCVLATKCDGRMQSPRKRMWMMKACHGCKRLHRCAVDARYRIANIVCDVDTFAVSFDGTASGHRSGRTLSVLCQLLVDMRSTCPCRSRSRIQSRDVSTARPQRMESPRYSGECIRSIQHGERRIFVVMKERPLGRR